MATTTTTNYGIPIPPLGAIGTADGYGTLMEAADGAIKLAIDNATDHVAITLDANANTLLSLSTQELGLDVQNANKVLAGPTTGADAVPSFRALVAADIPSLSSTYAPAGSSLVSTTSPVTVAVANNRRTYIQTTTNIEYDMPTGDLSAYVATGVNPLQFSFVKTTADTLTADPGAGNFIAGGGAGKKISDSTAGETWATLTLQLISSAASVNKWVITSGHGTWDLEA